MVLQLDHCDWVQFQVRHINETISFLNDLPTFQYYFTLNKVFLTATIVPSSLNSIHTKNSTPLCLLEQPFCITNIPVQ